MSPFTACTLALSPSRDTLTEDFSHFVTSMTAPVASGWSGCRVRLTPTGKCRLSTAHTRLGLPRCVRRPLHDFHCNGEPFAARTHKSYRDRRSKRRPSLERRGEPCALHPSRSC